MSTRTGSTILVACVVALNLVVIGGQSPSTDLDRKGPQIGARVPPFSGVDQHGRTQTLESVLKADGAMLVFYRSADW